ncbi:MAG: amidohydrolase family protein [Pseudomonadota bacterium]
MRLFDLHSHWGTERGYVLRTADALAQQKNTWNSTTKYDTEDQMAAYLRANEVRTILDFGFTKSLPLEQVVPLHDYALQTQAAYPDCIFGNWLQIDPRLGDKGAAELERCIQASKGFVSLCVSASGTGFPACDPVYNPFYEVALAHKRPVLVLVGHTGAGAGLRGGGGILLDLCHPRYIDQLAIDWPDLQIVSGRPAWPWQDEMISILIHKPNVWSELHGWSPKYLTDPFKKEIRSRLRKRVMFGADYPLFRYERLVADWRALGYDDEVLAAVFHGNAERLLGVSGTDRGAA